MHRNISPIRTKKVASVHRHIVDTLYAYLFGCKRNFDLSALKIFPELRSNEGNEHQNNTRVNVETVRHESVYIILYLTQT